MLTCCLWRPAFCGFSISEATPYLIKREFRKVVKGTILKARDIETFNRLTSIVPKEKVVQVSDMAFICPKRSLSSADLNRLNKFESWCDAAHNAGHLVIALCPNALQAEKIGYREYLEGMQLLINTFSQHIDCAVAFLYHDIRLFGTGGSDRTLSADLFNHYSDGKCRFISMHTSEMGWN